MAPSDVKMHDAIVYEINGKIYNGVALGSPSLGHHPGLDATSYHINLVYLNEQGTPVKIMGAPLLTKAMTDADLDKIAAAADSAQPTFEESGGGVRIRVANAAGQKEKILANPRTIGWRPVEDNEAVKALRASLDQSQKKVVELTQANAVLVDRADKSEKSAAAAQAEVEQLKAHVVELQAHIDELSKPAVSEAPETPAEANQDEAPAA